MFYLRIKLICVWFKYVVRFISITCFSCHQPSRHHPHPNPPNQAASRTSSIPISS